MEPLVVYFSYNLDRTSPVIYFLFKYNIKIYNHKPIIYSILSIIKKI